MIELIDRIYEAALIPNKWPDVCLEIARIPDGYAASIIAIGSDKTVRWITSANFDEHMDRFSRSELRFNNVRPTRCAELSPFSFARDIDIMSSSELADDPVYNALLRPHGFECTMGSVIQEPSGQTIVYDITGTSKKGAFTIGDREKLNVLRPHLARAGLIATQMAFERAQSAVSALAAIGLPTAALDASGAVVAMNPQMEGLEPRIQARARNRLGLENVSANALLDEAIERFRIGAHQKVQSIAVAATPDAPALVLHLVPVRRQAIDIFTRGLTLLTVTSVGLSGPPDARVLCGLFDLTGAEARIAREISTGASPDIVAARLTITVNTVRTYLKSIFTKTGTSRQSELVALLTQLTLPVSE